MNNNINNILEKYWNAEASLQEKAELTTYFASSDVTEEHKVYIGLFQHYADERLSHTDLDLNVLFNNLSNIDILLSKYWNAETSLEEEKILKAYFSGDDIAPEYQEYKSLFNYYDAAAQMTTDIELTIPVADNQDIDSLLAKYWNAETSIQEEGILKNYFLNEEIAEGHKEYQPLFSHFDTASQMSTGIDIASVLEDNKNSIDQLLKKYNNAETSLKEETLLAEYFASGEVADKHKSSEELFHFYDNQRSASSNLDLKALFEDQESKNGTSVSDTSEAPKPSRAKVFSIKKMASAIAAIFVLGFAAVTVMNQTSEPDTQYKGKYVQLDTEAEAQEAYEITKQAFALLSKKMNKGSNTVKSSVKKAENASIFK